MPSRFIQSIVASRNSSTLRSMPLRADNAWRRNWITDTPAISCGYWNARNIPALARTSGDQSVMSSPWKKTLPLVTSYSGEANRVLASVLLPEPLGPMMACASPALTVNDSPRRISPGFSLGADSLSAGLACRSSMRKSSLPTVVLAPVYFPYGRSGNPLGRFYPSGSGPDGVAANTPSAFSASALNARQIAGYDSYSNESSTYPASRSAWWYRGRLRKG